MCYADPLAGIIPAGGIVHAQDNQERRSGGDTVRSFIFMPLLDDVLTGEDRAYVIYD
jgi:hypothetical protein